MCRRQKKRLLLSIFAAALLLFAAAFFYLQKSEPRKTKGSKIGKYKNLKIRVMEPREVSEEEALHLMQSICKETQTEPTEEMKELIFTAMMEEQLYETQMEKREAVLREIWQRSSFPDGLDDPEETLLLAVYDKAGLKLTENEKLRGMQKLQEVFGAASAEELQKFLSPKEQLRIIKKEKTYEYLLENNRFIPVSSAPLS